MQKGIIKCRQGTSLLTECNEMSVNESLLFLFCFESFKLKSHCECLGYRGREAGDRFDRRTVTFGKSLQTVKEKIWKQGGAVNLLKGLCHGDFHIFGLKT